MTRKLKEVIKENNELREELNNYKTISQIVNKENMELKSNIFNKNRKSS